MKKKTSSGESHDKFLLELFKHGVSNAKPKNILGNFFKFNKKSFSISSRNRIINYKNIKQIFPICIGKASVDMAETSKIILKNFSGKVAEGIIVVNKENAKKVKGFKTFVSGHPIPTNKGLKASKYIEKYLEKTSKNDLVLLFLSGGGSALAPYPAGEISLHDKIKVNVELIESGANIKEINTVRKHLSKIKGGNFLNFSYPSNVHCLILSDVVGDDLSSIASGPTSPDNSTFKDTKKILTNFKIWNRMPISIKEHVIKGIKNPKMETPKKGNKLFSSVQNTIIGSNNLCLESIQNFCRNSKIKAKVWKKNIDMDVSKLPSLFIKELKNYNKRIKPIVYISGGETTVKIRGNGKGGRNQEFALHFMKLMKKEMPEQKYFLLSAGTDGRDGPTNAAGAIVNHNSLTEIKSQNINLDKELKNNNSYEVLKKINSLVIIKGTNTNVADLQILKIN